MNKSKHLICGLALLMGVACASRRHLPEEERAGEPPIPSAMREFRAAWVATVDNINWPSKPGLSTAQQQAEALALLDFLRDHHFNAVIFQVRPQADALFPSEWEPWSYYLTGKQGTAPDPFYDPLAFWIEEAHRRGLELHVWLNPYRAHHIAAGEVEPPSLVNKMPESVVKLKEGYWWFDPAKQSTQDHSAAVVMDIVSRYDIDGVHFDDYFYPYESYNGGADFPDDDTWAAYVAGGGTLSRGDWRRSHVNQFIERIYNDIKRVKKHVKFGLSPFGIWRPGHPESIAGMDQYDKLYADAKLWLNKGWVDYFTPQLYWPIAQIPQSFPVLLGWWQEENTQARHLWPGMNVGRGGDEANLREVVNQIMITRGMVPASKGAVHWSISSLTRNPLLAQGLLEGPYKQPALVPASPWLGSDAPDSPMVRFSRRGGEVDVSWQHPNTGNIAKWVLYSRFGNKWDYRILESHVSSLTLPSYADDGAVLEQVVVTAVDRLGNESERIMAIDGSKI
ncbi:glycoside hydrolase family 10 protein [Parapedobacter deserti]|uniref:Glycoside hydrolase family 10 protein n=1 Tax=Parapedobacter deserti TaxID=1912957 RepID=A0ABV7JPS7_9SPHI